MEATIQSPPVVPTVERLLILDCDLSGGVQEFKESVRKDRAKTPENMVTVGKEGTLGDVLNLMNQHTVHRVFVVMEKDGKQKVRDIITMTDVLKYILQEIRRG